MARQRVTLEQVAKAAGVSRATVSLVVRDSPLVADETREKVQRTMAALDYVRDIGAARLRSNSSRTIGLIVPNLVNPFFTEFLSGVEQVMGDQDRVVLLADSHDDPLRQDAILQRFRGHGVDGVILCPAQTSDPDLLTRMRLWNLPVVQALREIGPGHGDYAGADYRDGILQALRHLRNLGHRDIAFLSVTADTSARTERSVGFAQALAQTGTRNAGIIEADLTWDAAEQSAAEILATRATAVLCFNDVLAAGLILGLRRAGTKPGRDISVVGLDDLPLARMMHPALTSVAVHPRRIGNEAAALLGRRLRDPSIVPGRSILPTQLIVRDSTGRI